MALQPKGPIFSASSLNLEENSGTLVDVSGALLNYMQQLTFEQITKTVVGFQVQETTTPIVFYGLWQPMGEQSLRMQPEGQRKWNHYEVYTQLAIPLQPDDTILYLGEQYRVIPGRTDYRLEGYYRYGLVENYTGEGAGPTVIT